MEYEYLEDDRNYIGTGNFSYGVNKRDKKSNIYDLLAMVENVGYRVASYNAKKQTLNNTIYANSYTKNGSVRAIY